MSQEPNNSGQQLTGNNPTADSDKHILTAALFCLTNGGIALAIIKGGMFWIPPAMLGSLFLHRAAASIAAYPSRRYAQELDQFDDIRVRMEHLETSKIPESRRYILSAILEKKLAHIVSRESRRLVP